MRSRSASQRLELADVLRELVVQRGQHALADVLHLDGVVHAGARHFLDRVVVGVVNGELFSAPGSRPFSSSSNPGGFALPPISTTTS